MRPRCDHWTLPVMRRRVWLLNHKCRNPAKFRVESTKPGKVSFRGDTPCGVHVRPYLMDNGDSVRKPWVVTRLET